MERKIINTNVRFNLAREEDRRAYEHLCRMDRKKYRSYSRAVVTAVNAYFEWEQESAVPDRVDELLLQRIQRLMEQNTIIILDALQTRNITLGIDPEAIPMNVSESTEQNGQTALDFLDGF